MERTYNIQKILSDRFENGEKLYLVKWEGYNSTYNTWEPIESFVETDMIDAYERRKLLRQNAPAAGEVTTADSTSSNEHGLTIIQDNEYYEAEEVLGICGPIPANENDMCLAIKWKNIDSCSFLKRSEVRRRYPMQLIEFYEKRLYFIR